jgi:hypothetical protein
VLGGSWRWGWPIAPGLARLRGRAARPPERRHKGPFRPAELDRYARHIMLREVGGPGQKRLKIRPRAGGGGGGAGQPVLLYLAAAGVGTIGVIDDDTVEDNSTCSARSSTPTTGSACPRCNRP